MIMITRQLNSLIIETFCILMNHDHSKPISVALNISFVKKKKKDIDIEKGTINRF